jgi:hypothetical protein
MNLAQLQILKDEITTDPLARSYSAMTDAQIANDLNTLYRLQSFDRLDASTVFNAIDKAEYNVLQDKSKIMIWNILHLGEINPFGLEAAIFSDIFGAGSQTITDLKLIRKTPQSRAAELGLPDICKGYVIDSKLI